MLSLDLLTTGLIAFYISSVQAETTNQWATFPSVAKTASINGFADNIYDRLPECAKSCVEADTGSTPCPYWDTGCLCVMSNWSGSVAECIAENCKGDNVDSATSLALSICSSAGVPSPYWFIPASISTELQDAAAAAASFSSTTSEYPSDTQSTNDDTATLTQAPVTSTDETDNSIPTSSFASEETTSFSSAISDVPEVQDQTNAAAFNFPGNILVLAGLSALSFAAVLF